MNKDKAKLLSGLPPSKSDRLRSAWHDFNRAADIAMAAGFTLAELGEYGFRLLWPDGAITDIYPTTSRIHVPQDHRPRAPFLKLQKRWTLIDVVVVAIAIAGDKPAPAVEPKPDVPTAKETMDDPIRELIEVARFAAELSVKAMSHSISGAKREVALKDVADAIAAVEAMPPDAAWHPKPTCPGDWIGMHNNQIVRWSARELEAISDSSWGTAGYVGPIPEKPEETEPVAEPPAFEPPETLEVTVNYDGVCMGKGGLRVIKAGDVIRLRQIVEPPKEEPPTPEEPEAGYAGYDWRSLVEAGLEPPDKHGWRPLSSEEDYQQWGEKARSALIVHPRLEPVAEPPTEEPNLPPEVEAAKIVEQLESAFKLFADKINDTLREYDVVIARNVDAISELKERMFTEPARNEDNPTDAILELCKRVDALEERTKP